MQMTGVSGEDLVTFQLLHGPDHLWKSEFYSVGWALSLGSAARTGVSRGRCQTLTSAPHQPGLLGVQGVEWLFHTGPRCPSLYPTPQSWHVDYSGKGIDWLVNLIKPHLPQCGGLGSLLGGAHRPMKDRLFLWWPPAFQTRNISIIHVLVIGLTVVPLVD